MQKTSWKNTLVLTCAWSSESRGDPPPNFPLFFKYLPAIPNSLEAGTLAAAKTARKLLEPNFQGLGIFYVTRSCRYKRVNTNPLLFPLLCPPNAECGTVTEAGSFWPEDGKVKPREPEKVWEITEREKPSRKVELLGFSMWGCYRNEYTKEFEKQLVVRTLPRPQTEPTWQTQIALKKLWVHCKRSLQMSKVKYLYREYQHFL